MWDSSLPPLYINQAFWGLLKYDRSRLCTEVSQQLRELEQSGWLDGGTYRAKAETTASVGGKNLELGQKHVKAAVSDIFFQKATHEVNALMPSGLFHDIQPDLRDMAARCCKVKEFYISILLQDLATP